MSDAWDGLPPEEWREKCAWHWFETPHGDRIPILWNYTRWEKNALPNLRTEDCWQAHECRYLAPCLSPDEIAALRARAERAEMCVRTARAEALREAVEIIRSRVQVRIEPHFRAAASKIEAGIAGGMAAMADDVAAAISDLIMRTVPKEKPMERDDGGPAFPVESYDHEADMDTVKLGMTLRDYFAAAALVGIASQRGGYPSEWARLCYQVADAMLAARRKEPDA